jgi:hypothetical protein
MQVSRIAESIIAEVRPARKIDRIRNIWADIQKLRSARLTYRQILAQLPKFGIDDMSFTEFRCICYRIHKTQRISSDVAGRSSSPLGNPIPEFDPLEDAKRRREEKTRPIFQQRKEG